MRGSGLRSRRQRGSVLVAFLLIGALGAVVSKPAVAADAPVNGLIAYSGGRGGALYSDFDIWLANPSGTGDTKVVRDGSTFAVSPTWSPDGNRFAFARGLTGTDAGIWIANADGTGQTRVVAMPYAADPHWAHDGSLIAFWVNWTANPGNGGIWTVRPDGTNLTHVTDDEAADDPAVSPDGTRIAFHGAIPDGWGIYVMNADGTGRIRIVDDSVLDWSGFDGIDWSLDGNSILFAAHTGAISGPGACSGSSYLPHDLYRVNPDGTGLTKLTDTSTWNGPHETNPTYSPDRTRIVHLSFRVDCVNGAARVGKQNVYVIAADGSGAPVQISDFTEPALGAVGSPGWQPCSVATTYRCVFVPPGKPTQAQAFAADGSAFVSWEPPADDGGPALTGFIVTATPGGASVTIDQYSINAEIPGLNNGTAYTFRVKAVNGAGTGPESAPSNAVTPRPGAFPSGPQGLEGSVLYNVFSGIRSVDASGEGDRVLPVSGFFPSWAPDGNSILYVAGSRIYTSNTDGSSPRLVSNHPDAIGSAARWSPDGSKILHWGWYPGMWVLDPATSVPSLINDNATNGAWSPDGTRIAFTSGEPDNWGVYVMNADGSNRIKLVGTEVSGGPLPAVGWTGDEGLDWSTDGHWIVFAVHGPILDPPLGSQCLSSEQSRDVWMVRPDGTGLRRLTDTATWFGPHETNPWFSPDGSAILLAVATTECVGSQMVQNPQQIVSVNRNGVGTNQLTSSSPWASRPAMQPCGPDTTQCGVPVPPPPPPPPATKLYCQGLAATIQGDGGDNVLEGTPGDDVIHGGDGDDVIRGKGGNDVICGGSGNDALYGGDGDDTLLGGGGDDHLYGGAGNDLLKGQRGSDRSYGGGGDDRIRDGSGADTLFGHEGKDRMWGGIGDDVLDGGEGNDQLHGGRDDDTLRGGEGTDRIWGDAGDDSLFGDANSDFLYGGIGVDTLFGGDGNDRLFGWTGDDVLYGGNGRDQLRGQDGDDLVDGGPQKDWCSIEAVRVDCEAAL